MHGSGGPGREKEEILGPKRQCSPVALMTDGGDARKHHQTLAVRTGGTISGV